MQCPTISPHRGHLSPGEEVIGHPPCLVVEGEGAVREDVHEEAAARLEPRRDLRYAEAAVMSWERPMAAEVPRQNTRRTPLARPRTLARSAPQFFVCSIISTLQRKKR